MSLGDQAPGTYNGGGTCWQDTQGDAHATVRPAEPGMGPARGEYAVRGAIRSTWQITVTRERVTARTLCAVELALFVIAQKEISL
jgi:hypothetical protein